MKLYGIREKIYSIVEPKYNNDDSRLARIYDWVMLIAIFIGILPLMFREHNRMFYIFDISSCVLYIIDYLLRWFTADMRHKRRGKWAFLIYPFTAMAIVDLLSILPTFNFVREAFKLSRMVRLLKIVRVIKVLRYFEPLMLIQSVIVRQRKVLATVFSLAIFYVFVTALIMFNAEVEINPETGRYLFHDFFDAFYWAACTLTTVGYGDITPVSNVGRVISILSSIVGIAIIALPSGIITAAYMDELKLQRRNSRKTTKKQEKTERIGQTGSTKE